MDFAPSSRIGGQSDSNELKISILSRGGRISGQIRSLVEANLPTARLSLSTTAASLLNPDRAFQPDILILDFGALSQADADFVHRLRATLPDTRVIILCESHEITPAYDLFNNPNEEILQFGPSLPGSLRGALAAAMQRGVQVENPRELSKIQNVTLAAVSDQMLDLLIVVDSEGMILYGNRAWRETVAGTPEERLFLADLMHSNDLHRLEAELQLAIIENTAGKVLFRVKALQRDWATIQATLFGVELGGQRAACICGRNITAYHRAQIQLGEIEQKLKLLEGLSSEVVYRIDGWNQLVQFVSAPFQTLTGYPPSDWINSPDELWKKLLAPEHFTDRAVAVEKLIARGASATTQTLSYPLKQKDGGEIWVQELLSIEWSRDALHYWINGLLKDVTAEHLARESFETAQADHRRLFDELLEGYAELELLAELNGAADFRITACNHTFEQIAGLPLEKLAQSRFGELFPGLPETPISFSDGRSLTSLLSETAVSGKTLHLRDFYWPHLRGYFQITALRLKPGFISLSLIDITLQRQAEIRLETVLHGLPDTALYQTGGGVEYISHGIERLLGYTAEELTSDRTLFPTLIHPDDSEATRSAQRNWIKAGATGVVEMEFRVRRKDGAYIWLLDRMSKAFTAPDGRISSHGVMIDITARKKAEAEYRRKSAEYDLLFEAVPDLYFRLDRTGVILDWAGGSPKDLYLPPEQFLGKRMQDVLPANVSVEFKLAVENMERGEEAHSFEYSLQIGGRDEFFEARFFPLPDAQRGVLVRNITEKRHQEDVLRRRNLRLQVLSEFAITLNRLTRSSKMADATAEVFLKDSRINRVALLIGDEQSLVVARAWSNDRDVSQLPGRVILTGECPALAEALQQARPAACPGDSKVFAELLTESDEAQVFAFFPLSYSGELQGGILLVKPPPDEFDVDELEELAPITHMLAEALSRAEAQEELEQSFNFLGAVFDQSPIASWVADATGTIIRANQACKELFHIPPESRFPVSFSIFDNPQYQSMGLIEEVRKVFEKGIAVSLPPVHYDYTESPFYKPTDHVRVTVKTTLIPIKDSYNRVTNIIAQLSDITGERRPEKRPAKRKGRS